MLRAEKGDKVRIRAGKTVGARGVVESVQGSRVVILLEGQRNRVRIPATAVTNLSLAARKAWKTMPSRRVGRPATGRDSDRLSVTLRIDRDVWRRFQALEERGLIEDRVAIVNSWFLRGVAKLAKGAS